ncbi:SLAP domain-containing protein [Companilactobacillus nantensis]|uniref:S-layer protein C-terminal domain-containing protein n=1 Tax=Companilactobacillus nantensis DSM 16982 TaxID=1423774 RepID=A0A0R1WIM8_9LACO|nr:SLAP domain-containing protein [Companilactobacillus nantensis]KRM17794.1 hypothetical protein FD31_GL002314 [Companilactobacillus nantensis DSM 16982]GEO63493.1 hypothetical protein LNA01_06760 [Companilactobacillus nantensis]
MKLSKAITFIAMFLVAATGAILTSQNDTQAAKIATTITGRGPITLYTSDGTKITDRALSPNTEWAVGNTILINGFRYYQVATNEYLDYNDATLSDVQNPVQEPLIGTVMTNNQSGTVTIDKNLNYMSPTPRLPEGSKWKIGQCLVNTFGEIYVEVARNTYVPAVHMIFNQILPSPTYDQSFFYQPLRDPQNTFHYSGIDEWFNF